MIVKINDQISFSCRVYGRARDAMVRLRADDNTLNRFRILLKEDVSASTAILNPNIPGSSNRCLSWIWQTGPLASSLDTMRECMSSYLGSGSRVNLKWTEIRGCKPSSIPRSHVLLCEPGNNYLVRQSQVEDIDGR